MSKRNPYVGLPDYQFWKKEPAITNPKAFDPVIKADFVIKKQEPVVTAGSCFAQHVARYLTSSGFNHLITENAHPLINEDTAKAFNYGMFAARYGNIYTARQLKQLLLRAYGQIQPIDTAWEGKDPNTVVDPFRPQIQPGGFSSQEELIADQTTHFLAIRKAIESMSVFVFTLGLTECWIDKRDGTVYPLAPGVAGGIYDPSKVEFHNFSLKETFDDLLFSLNLIRALNQNVKFILTVSPVPLNATREDKHVFVSTTYSKSILRVAAEEASRSLENCAYFPSYEIITSPYSRGAYFDTDCRNVTEEGVNHVMNLFLAHYGDQDSEAYIDSHKELQEQTREQISAMQNVLDVLCDEEAIDNE